MENPKVKLEFVIKTVQNGKTEGERKRNQQLLFTNRVLTSVSWTFIKRLGFSLEKQTTQIYLVFN